LRIRSAKFNGSTQDADRSLSLHVIVRSSTDRHCRPGREGDLLAQDNRTRRGDLLSLEICGRQYTYQTRAPRRARVRRVKVEIEFAPAGEGGGPR
jgi:hypothetical protein